ncbi:MAG: tRNA (guanosine(37)-N1)-methyltransferase TrmD [Candidatus Dormibacteria bacterium]
MRFDVVTLFPEMVLDALSHGVVGRGRTSGAIELAVLNPRDFAEGSYRQVDDEPYGGGAGMVMKPEPLFAAVEAARAVNPGPVVLLTPRGARFDQAGAQRYAGLGGLILVSGRYEGVDERVHRHLADEELSLGDFVLSGGEAAAVCVVDAVARLCPGVLGRAQSLEYESFSSGLLEYPQYTRPAEFRGWRVPEVLLSGDHQRIDRWRREQSLEWTKERRPDLLPDTRGGSGEPG